MQSAVSFNGVLSRWFDVKQSVRQGGVLSPWLYMLYVNQLLDLLRKSNVGLWIENLFVGVVAQADDVCLLAVTPCDLQAMLDIVYAYSCKWRYTFNASKTVILVFGEDARSF